MAYMHHIENLYRPSAQVILLLKELFALEKIHGTGSKILYKKDSRSIQFFSGGEKHERFVALFNEPELLARFGEISPDYDVTVYGEAYGGKQQGMSATYGPNLKFIAFEVQVGERWLSVENAFDIVTKLGLEFVPFKRIPCNIEAIDAERDADSEVAIRNGMGSGKKREGVVLRPLVELTLNNGARVIAKHKRDEFRETKSPRVVQDPELLKTLSDAEQIAAEWVTENRMEHVLQRIPDHDMSKIPQIISAMVEDVLREGSGEIVDSKSVRKAISTATAKLYKSTLTKSLTNVH